MKQLTRFSAWLLCLALPLFFISCNNEQSKTEPETKAADTAVATVEKVNTIVTTPEIMGVVRHKVKDYAAWKASYDSRDSMRLANGIHSYVIGRGMDDSMMVLVALKVDNLDKAKAFSKDPGLKAAMKKGGVIGTPEISFVNVVWQDTVNVGRIPRVMTTYSVKDWDTWKKAFEESKTDRIANGIVDRQYGHDADDNKKISTVTALTDVDKAKAHWSSDAMKKRIADAGLTTTPNRFIFNIVQRY
jgi:hypothetical protein